VGLQPHPAETDSPPKPGSDEPALAAQALGQRRELPEYVGARSWGAEDAARTVLLLHGATSSSRTWWQVAPQLAQHNWHVIAVDLQGHGAAPAGGAPAIAAMARSVLELLRARRIDLLLGHSLGAVVATELLRLCPNATHRLILDEPPGPNTVDWANAVPYLEHEQHLARRDALGHAAQMNRALPFWHPTDCLTATEDLAAHNRSAVADALAEISTGEWVRTAPSIHAPTLVMAGPETTGQYVFGGDYGSSIRGDERAQLVASLPRAKLTVFGRGHVLHRDNPSEWVTRVDRFGRCKRCPG
jgi:pimeloyl-ACP methyl ester carboxylesterase